MTEVRHELFEEMLKLFTPSGWWFPKKPLTPGMHTAWLEQARSRVEYDCAYMHNNHCLVESSLGAVRWLMRAYKTYLLIHVAQHLLFKKERFKGRSLLRLLRNILQTYLFFGFYAFVAKFFMCYGSRITPKFDMFWSLVMCSVGASTIFLERSSRWPEFAMNIYPKFLESISPFLSKQKLWVDIPFGHHLLLGLSLGIISHIYYKSPVNIKKLFLSVGHLIVGDRQGLVEDKEQQ